MRPVGVGPLSYGQLFEWRSIDTLPREQWHEDNTWSRWSLPDGTETSQVRAALRALAARHPTLRTVFDLDDPASPRQLIVADHDVEIPAVECGTEDETATMATEMLRHSFDLRGSVGWRARIRTESGRPTEVFMVRHHMIADGSSDGVLQRDFQQFLRSPVPVVPAAGPLDLATWQRSAEQERTRGATAAYWERVFTSGVGKGFPGADSTVAGPFQCVVRSRPAHAHATKHAAQTRTSLSSVVLAAYTLAIARVTGVEQQVAHSMCANRFHPQWRQLVTSMNQAATVPLTVVEDPAEHISRVHRAAMTAYRHGMYDADTIAALRTTSALRAGSDVHKPTCGYNFFPWQDLTEPPANGPEPVWEEPTTTLRQGIYFRAADEGSSLKLRLQTNGVDKDQVAAIMKHLHTLLSTELP